MFELDKPPQFEIKDLVGSLLISLGVVLFLTCLHLLTINSLGYTNSVLNTVFGVFLKISIAIATIVSAFVLIYGLRILVYFASTPKWLREEHKNGK